METEFLLRLYRSVRWRRRDSRLVDESWFQSDGTLLLPAHVTNTGFYQCVAENDAGIAMSNFTAVYCKLVFVCGIVLGNSVYNYTFLRSEVYLSVVCHIRALWLKPLDRFRCYCGKYICGVQIRPMTNCVTCIWRPLAPIGHYRFGDQIPSPSENTQLQIAAVTWTTKTRMDFAFSQITFVLLLLGNIAWACKDLVIWSYPILKLA